MRRTRSSILAWSCRAVGRMPELHDAVPVGPARRAVAGARTAALAGQEQDLERAKRVAAGSPAGSAPPTTGSLQLEEPVRGLGPAAPRPGGEGRAQGLVARALRAEARRAAPRRRSRCRRRRSAGARGRRCPRRPAARLARPVARRRRLLRLGDVDQVVRDLARAAREAAWRFRRRGRDRRRRRRPRRSPRRAGARPRGRRRSCPSPSGRTITSSGRAAPVVTAGTTPAPPRDASRRAGARRGMSDRVSVRRSGTHDAPERPERRPAPGWPNRLRRPQERSASRGRDRVEQRRGRRRAAAVVRRP